MNAIFLLVMSLLGAGSVALGLRGSSDGNGGSSDEGDNPSAGNDIIQGGSVQPPAEETGNPFGNDIPEETTDPEPVPEQTPEDTTASVDSPSDDSNADEPTNAVDQPSDDNPATPELPSTSIDDQPASALHLLGGGSIGDQGLDTNGPITLEFSDDIRWGDGTIELRMFDGNSYVTVETFGRGDFGDEPDSAVRIVDNRLLIQPTSQLEILRDYALRIDAGAIESFDGAEFSGVPDDTTATFVSGSGMASPSLDPNDYDRVIIGETFTETFDVNQNYNNTLFIDCNFTDIDGYGMRLGDVSNVTIYNCSFENISGTGILLRSTLSTDSVSIISNTFENIGGDAIHAAKRYETGVDHEDLLIQDNQIHNVGLNGGSVYHGIYTQSSEAVILGNSITGHVDSNAISIRGDGIVSDNYINVTSGREYGSAIKYYSDHETGDSKKLIIADNVIESGSLYSGIELSMPTHAIPNSYEDDDWVVNDFHIMRNTIDARNDYVIDPLLEQQTWASIEIYEDDLPETSAATMAWLLPEVPVAEVALLPEEEETLEFDLGIM